MSRRLAVYAAPTPGSRLFAFARRWLGRDPVSGLSVPQPNVPGIAPPRLHAITASPRHYGFHATLKPPLRLAKGRSIGGFHDAVASLAATLGPVRIEHLAPRAIDGFIALVPDTPTPALERLAERVVVALDAWRAPPPEDELERRRARGLSPRQEELLHSFGYPHVLDQFRFHMTLTGRVPEAEQAVLLDWLDHAAAEFRELPWTIDALVVFEQADASSPFLETARYQLRGAAPADPA